MVASSAAVPTGLPELIALVFRLLLAAVSDGSLPPVEVSKLIMSRMLGYGVVIGASVIKVPQILAVVRSGSAKGINALSLEIETFAFAVALANMIQTGLPFSGYGELVFVVVQNLILDIIVHSRNQSGVVRATIPTAIFASLAASFYLGQIPHNVIEVTTSLTLLLIIFARVPQIMQSYTNKSTGQLSGLSQFMQVAGGCARLFTGMTEGASAAVLAGNVIGTSLNIAIMSQIIMYRGSDDDKPKKKL